MLLKSFEAHIGTIGPQHSYLHTQTTQETSHQVPTKIAKTVPASLGLLILNLTE